MKTLFSLILIACSLQLQAQDSGVSVETIRKRFAEQLSVYPQEKIYIHTDKPGYISGEPIWFKVYVADATLHTPVTYSRFAYVELINPHNEVLERVKLRLGAKDGHGSIVAKENYPEGFYTLRAYTGTMFDDPQQVFTRLIYIAVPESAELREEIRFRPENNRVTAEIRFISASDQKTVTPKRLSVKELGEPQKIFNPDSEGIYTIPVRTTGRSRDNTIYIEAEYKNMIYRKYVSVPVFENAIDVAFLPEGGSLIAGYSNTVGFKALAGNGAGMEIKGSIIDSEGNLVVPFFESRHRGMGRLEFIPEYGKEYRAVIETEENGLLTFDLPEVHTDIAGLHVNKLSEKFLVTLKGEPRDDLYLIVHSRGVCYYSEPWDSSQSSATFNCKDFPSGVLQILLLDSHLNPLSERLVFCRNDDQAKTLFSTEAKQYGPRERVEARLAITGSESQPLPANYSVSVINKHDIEPDTDNSILTHFLLTSELRGEIEEPSFYFTGEPSETDIALDDLMLTQGWRRYNVPQIMRGNYEQMKGFIEMGQEITGRVTNLGNGKPAPGCTVTLLCLKYGYATETESDENGKFVFNGFSLPGGAEYVVQAFSPKKGNRIALELDQEEFPEPTLAFKIDDYIASESPLTPDYISKADTKYTLENGMRMIHLKGVTVSAKRRDPGTIYMPLPQTSFDSEKIEQIGASRVMDILYRVPGIRIVGNRIQMRGETSIMKSSHAVIAMDGMIIDEYYDLTDFDLDHIDITQIERVDIYKGGEAAVWGHRGGNGVVHIITKKGIGSLTRMAPETYNTEKITPLGFHLADEFYSPIYITAAQREDPKPDLRTTIYWNPNLFTDEKGESTFSFYTSDDPGSYCAIIQGVAETGEIINLVQDL